MTELRTQKGYKQMLVAPELHRQIIELANAQGRKVYVVVNEVLALGLSKCAEPQAQKEATP